MEPFVDLAQALPKMLSGRLSHGAPAHVVQRMSGYDLMYRLGGTMKAGIQHHTGTWTAWTSPRKNRTEQTVL
jgi:hypothetical protein